MVRPSLGPLVKARVTVKLFLGSAPSPRELLANRTQRFERYHAILPSTATAGEALSLTVQAWGQCERLVEGVEGTGDPRGAGRLRGRGRVDRRRAHRGDGPGRAAEHRRRRLHGQGPTGERRPFPGMTWVGLIRVEVA